MAEQDFDETALRRYVLGMASQPERTAIEDAMFTSDDTFEALEALEAEVLADYESGRLPPDEAAAFEALAANSPRLRHEVTLARDLRSAVRPSRAADPLAVSGRWLAVAAGLLLAVAASLLIVRPGADPTVIVQAPAAVEPPTAAPGPGSAVDDPPPIPTPQPSSPPVLAVITLASVSVRSASPALEIARPEASGVVEFRLLLDPADDYPRYSAELSGAATPGWTGESLPVRRGADAIIVIATIPSDRLRPGRHELVLSGETAGRLREELAVYRFAVRP